MCALERLLAGIDQKARFFFSFSPRAQHSTHTNTTSSFLAAKQKLGAAGIMHDSLDNQLT
jgi:hypothetical protein